MVLWIEQQSSLIIALIMFAVCYAIALAVFALACVLGQRPIAAELKLMTPVMLTPLSVVAALMMAFLAVRVWANVDQAVGLIGQEASAARETLLFAEAIPEPTRGAVRGGVQTYLHWVEAEDWPAMLAGAATLQTAPPGLSEAMASLLAFAPSGPGQAIAHQNAVAAVQHALETRRRRVLLSHASLSQSQWSVVLVLDALILLTIAAVHIDRRVPMAAALLLFSSAVAACLIVLMVNDRPFGAGGVTLKPTALHELQIE